MMVLIEQGDITELLASGQFAEGPQLEAKRASGSIPRNVWDSCSAFANTSGGVIVLGLDEREDGWVPTGVASAASLIQDLFNQIRDPQKISFPFASNDDIWPEVVDGVTLIVIRVRAAPRRMRPVFINNRREQTYVRRGEGDFQCSESEIDRMRLNAGTTRYDQTIYSNLGWEAFDPDTIERYRRLSEQQKPDLPHHRRDDQEFLRLVGAWRKDWDTGEEGPTLAGVLMFGREDVIRYVRPNHVIDYRRLPIGGLSEEGERFADRVRWTGNLFGAWETIFPYLNRGLSMPFRQRGVHRVDQRVGLNTLREAFINMLVHTDYQESSDAVIIQRDDGYIFRNPGDSWVDVRELGMQGRSERRNPGIAQLFDNLGLAEQAGSGYATILEEWQKLGYTPPVIDSDSLAYEFSLNLALTHLIEPDDRQWLQRMGGLWKPEEAIALIFARHEGRIDNVTLRNVAGIDVLAASQILRSLRDRQLLILQGNGKNAFYLPGPRMLAESRLDRTDIDGLTDQGDGLDREPDGLTDQGDGLDREPDGLTDQGDGLDHEPHNQSLLLNYHSSEMLLRIAGPLRDAKKSPSAEQVKETLILLCGVEPLSVRQLSEITNRKAPTLRPYLKELQDQRRLRKVDRLRGSREDRYGTVSASTAQQQRLTLPDPAKDLS